MDDPVRNWTALAETAWYDPGRHGAVLLKRFIRYGKKHSVDEVRLTTLNTTPAGVTGLLTNIGFETVEFSHRLIL